MKYLILLAALLLACGPATAQTPRGATPPNSLTSPLAAAPAGPDTVAAIHRLFAAKRTRGRIITGVLAAGALSAAFSIADDGWFSRGDYIILYSLLASPFVVGNLLYHASYSKKREARAQADFEAHRLSPGLKRRLKPRYFQ